jgi:hypothetical protein
MARFSKSTLQQVAGFDGQILAEEIYYGVDDYWNITVATPNTSNTGISNSVPINLTGWNFKLRLIRRQVDAVVDTRNQGIELINLQPTPGATEMNLDTNVTVVDAAAGLIRVLIDDTFFSQVQPIIDTIAPPVYTGYVGMEMPAVGTIGQPNYIPAQQKKVLLLFIVRSDGISAQTSL